MYNQNNPSDKLFGKDEKPAPKLKTTTVAQATGNPPQLSKKLSTAFSTATLRSKLEKEKKKPKEIGDGSYLEKVTAS
jgi:hypothetical protein